MRRSKLAAGLALGSCLLLPLLANAQANQDVENHLSLLRSRLEERDMPVDSRAQATIELATALDRAAQSAANGQVRRDRWTEAIKVLEAFDSKHPDSTKAREVRFQIALYIWARGHAWAEHFSVQAWDNAARDHAIENLDAALERFRNLVKESGSQDNIFTQNSRFRLAQCLADRSEFEAINSDARRVQEREAIDVLGRPMADAELNGFALLLKATLLARRGEDKEADLAFVAAEKAPSPPPAAEILNARVTAAIDSRRFAQAQALVEKSSLEPAEKALSMIRILLAKRESVSVPADREQIEREIFERYKPLRQSTDPEAKRVLMLMSRQIERPASNQGADALTMLADGAALLGNLKRAGNLESEAADRLQAANSMREASELRLRAGAYLFQAGEFVKAEALLARVVEDPLAGASRPKAGLLRSLACGRALATKQQGMTAAKYVQSLEYQIKEFGSDPSANEARWLLAKFQLANADRDAARKLWMAITRSDPHWLEARIQVAELNQEDVDLQRLNQDRAAIIARYGEGRAFLAATLNECRDAGERASVDLALARLEVTPIAGHPDEARTLCEGVLRVAGRAEQREQARRLHIVVVVQQNHFLEAEFEAKAETTRSKPSDLLATARLIDFVASGEPNDLRLRRVGLILRILLSPVLENAAELTDIERAEAKIRETRALSMIGDDGRARSSLLNWGTMPQGLDDWLLRDLADTYARLNAYNLAVDVQRLRARQAKVGSLRWFEARYGLALAYYRWGKEQEARKLIDATSILHPELGGGDLRDKYVILRQRLGSSDR